MPIPTGADLLKIFIYWDEPFYNNYPANIQAVLLRTLSANCNGAYIPVHWQSSSDTTSTKYTKGNWLHFVLDNSQPDNFARVVENRCYRIDINGVSVPDGYGNVNNGHRTAHVAWFFEDLDRNDMDGPCRHDPTTCPVEDSSYLYFH